jgi:hypothetical protein
MEDRTDRPCRAHQLTITDWHLPWAPAKKQDRTPLVLPHLHELRGRPLTRHEVIVNTIAATTTRTEFAVRLS